MKVLGYGRKRSVILEAPAHDPNCVLANILAANFLCSSNPSLAPSYLHAANTRLVILSLSRHFFFLLLLIGMFSLVRRSFFYEESCCGAQNPCGWSYVQPAVII